MGGHTCPSRSIIARTSLAQAASAGGTLWTPAIPPLGTARGVPRCDLTSQPHHGADRTGLALSPGKGLGERSSITRWAVAKMSVPVILTPVTLVPIVCARRPQCRCRCVCPHSPNRLLSCDACGSLIGPGCCAVDHQIGAPTGICHCCYSGNPQETREHPHIVDPPPRMLTPWNCPDYAVQGSHLDQADLISQYGIFARHGVLQHLRGKFIVLRHSVEGLAVVDSARQARRPPGRRRRWQIAVFVDVRLALREGGIDFEEFMDRDSTGLVTRGGGRNRSISPRFLLKIMELDPVDGHLTGRVVWPPSAAEYLSITGDTVQAESSAMHFDLSAPGPDHPMAASRRSLSSEVFGL